MGTPWSETTASNCKWGNCAKKAFLEPLVLWEHSVDDYQGHANFLGWTGAALVHYRWDYGSCSGCDPWEDEYDSDPGHSKLVERMRADAQYFDDIEEFRKYVQMVLGEKEGYVYGAAWIPQEGIDTIIAEAEGLLHGAVQPLGEEE